MKEILISLNEKSYLETIYIDGNKVFDNKEVPQNQGTWLEISLNNFTETPKALKITHSLL